MENSHNSFYPSLFLAKFLVSFTFVLFQLLCKAYLGHGSL